MEHIYACHLNDLRLSQFNLRKPNQQFPALQTKSYEFNIEKVEDGGILLVTNHTVSIDYHFNTKNIKTVRLHSSIKSNLYRTSLFYLLT